jgi:acetylornithine deacetylase/succinyl-diaminopimelate desuccinylase-like protein
LFGLGKGWKINRSKIESLKDFAKHLEKFNKNVEKIEKEVEGIKDALTTKVSEPVLKTVDESYIKEGLTIKFSSDVGGNAVIFIANGQGGADFDKYQPPSCREIQRSFSWPWVSTN